MRVGWVAFVALGGDGSRFLVATQDLDGSEMLDSDTAAALPPLERASLRGLGPMHLRGRDAASHVYRVQWQIDHAEDATMMGRSVNTDAAAQMLVLVSGDQTVEVRAGSPRIAIGRGAEADLSLNDPRVSRMHATVECRGGQFVLLDASSYGTWVYMGGQAEAVVLRRTECYLVGTGQISAGCERKDDAPLIIYSVRR